jgi:hypothetical protein
LHGGRPGGDGVATVATADLAIEEEAVTTLSEVGSAAVGTFEESAGQIVDSRAFRLSTYKEDIVAMGVKAQGDCGEGVAQNYLASKGITTASRHTFEGKFGGCRPDLYNPLTNTAHESKLVLCTSWDEVSLQVQNYNYALETGQFSRVVYLNVEMLGDSGFSGRLLPAIGKFGMITLA